MSGSDEEMSAGDVDLSTAQTTTPLWHGDVSRATPVAMRSESGMSEVDMLSRKAAPFAAASTLSSPPSLSRKRKQSQRFPTPSTKRTSRPLARATSTSLPPASSSSSSASTAAGHRSRGRTQQDVDHLTEALVACEPQLGRKHHYKLLLALLYLRGGDVEKSRKLVDAMDLSARGAEAVLALRPLVGGQPGDPATARQQRQELMLAAMKGNGNNPIRLWLAFITPLLASDPYDAIRVLKLLTAKFPDTSDYWNALGVAYARTDQMALADEALQRAAFSTANNTTVLGNLASLRIQQGRYDEAIPFLEASLQVDHNQPHAYSQLALCWLKCHNVVQAQSALRKAQSNSRSACPFVDEQVRPTVLRNAVNYRLSQLLQCSSGDKAQIQRLLREVEQKLLDYTSHARASQDDGWVEAVTDWLSFFRSGAVPSKHNKDLDVATKLRHASMALRQSNPRQASDTLRTVIHQLSQLSTAPTQPSSEDVAMSASSTSSSLSSSAVSMAPPVTKPSVHTTQFGQKRAMLNAVNALGIALHQDGKYDEAMETYQKGLETFPTAHQLHNNMGNTLRALGRFADATACFKRCLDLAPRFALAYNNLALTAVAQGDLANAKVMWKEALKVDPALHCARQNLSKLRKQMKKKHQKSVGAHS